MSCAACSFAFSRSAAMLEARRSAAAVAGSERPLDCTALSTVGAGCLSRAAAVEALVRGAMVEKSLQAKETVGRQSRSPDPGRGGAGGRLALPSPYRGKLPPAKVLRLPRLRKARGKETVVALAVLSRTVQSPRGSSKLRRGSLSLVEWGPKPPLTPRRRFSFPPPRQAGRNWS